MKKITIIVCMALLIAVNVGCAKSESGSVDTGKDVPLETMRQKASYSMGYNMGITLKMRGLVEEMDFDILLKGFKDAALKEKGQISEQEMQQILQAFSGEFRTRQDEKRKVQGEKNKVEGEKFLAENAKKPGVMVTASGLQYMVLKEGTGASPAAVDIVEVHYVGTLLDGTEFDSSIKRGQPAKFPLNRVIPAWTEGLQLMKVGSKYRLFAPPALAYKENGQGPVIGPNAVLIFDVELLGFQPSQAPVTPPAEKKEQPKPTVEKK